MVSGLLGSDSCLKSKIMVLSHHEYTVGYLYHKRLVVVTPECHCVGLVRGMCSEEGTARQGEPWVGLHGKEGVEDGCWVGGKHSAIPGGEQRCSCCGGRSRGARGRQRGKDASLGASWDTVSIHTM